MTNKRGHGLRGDWLRLVRAAARAGWTIERRRSGHIWLRRGTATISLSGSDDVRAIRNATKDCARAGIAVKP